MNTVPKNENDPAAPVGAGEAPLDNILAVKKRINARLYEFAGRRSYHAACEKFMASVHAILLSPSAKRVRGILPVLIGERLEAEPEECLLQGLAVELLHFTSLVHDDVIDEDTNRRGIPTLNRSFANNQAVLIGDYMMCEVINYGLRCTHSRTTIRMMVSAVQDLVAGLIMEQNVLPVESTLENYTEMVRLKTGALYRLSFGLPFVADDRLPGALTCGRLFGLLFQIYDDYLDRKQDRNGQNIFTILPRRQIARIWMDTHAEMKEIGRELGIDAVLDSMDRYLRSNGYFLNFWQT